MDKTPKASSGASDSVPLSRRRWLSPVMRVLNIVPKAILRTRFHALMSGDLMLLEFPGRISGASYVLPVSFVDEAEVLLIGTDRRWRHNIRTGDQLNVWFKGQQREANAEVEVGQAELARLFETMLPRNPALGRLLGITLNLDGTPNHRELQHSVKRGVAVLRLNLLPLPS